MNDFRALHVPGDPLVLPNAWDVASAAALARAGFAAIGTTSLGVAAAHGLPDGRGEGRTETIALMRRLGRLPVLVTVDVEGGFGGGPAAVADLAADLAEAGAVGINLEDGHADGTLAPVADQVALIEAVKARVPGLFVNARTDTRWLDAGDLDETLARTRAYAAAGADGVFVPGLADEDDIRAVVSGVDAPLNVLLLPGLTVPALAKLGVARISTGSMLFRTALGAAVAAARAVAAGEPAPTGIPPYAEVNALASDGRN
ncbi:isocitrate lyase/phosphoenolpyruvate mutase family protein [Amorphoplanes digitatis]|uniref:2-methylisocitrate lyase-like PEP mutase family enzyme n=1 Tax=Actinoplanes digitatis TaxID=1868 RepID=A0A7W7MQN1_9ACTN|nr:isocitrate lyase/phosphoenolpyruvate mutase family protein [Actinoplanes digitatis]MBB4762725.1 2-methylisocitrate lyase-like PEP mutase family enzyme [Actinoplanes digitatis]GID91779.1 phosphonomutase [Actinoplanes digitatis]